MEKCDMCGKPTTIMQLGVRRCHDCGESVIRVCRACDTFPFYCKSCKEKQKSGKGWKEQPDPTLIVKGKPVARRHHEAQVQAQAGTANNIPMTCVGFLRQTKKQYIVTGHESLSKISTIGCTQQFSHQRAFSDILTDWLGYHGIILTEKQFDLVEELVDNWFKGHHKCSREKKDTLAKRIVRELKLEAQFTEV